jgi:homotetrameric cytidine deaminase/rRNA maturation RNase YbeY
MIRLMIEQTAEASYNLPVLERLAEEAARVEGLAIQCTVYLWLCDDAQIRAANRELRGVDRVTDVLSFPTVQYSPGSTAGSSTKLLQLEWNAEECACFLGDIMISVPQARRQALEYGHMEAREIAYLLAHGLFHLMGYDHEKDWERTAMRHKEEQSLQAVGMARITDEELLQRARDTMKHAYVPYSHYRVGASLLAADGRVFDGCNVENASYGLTNCAERTALFKAVSEGATQFTTLTIAAEGFPPWPCGACRQVLSEFCANLRVLVTYDGKVEQSTLQELLPHSFSPASGVQTVLKGTRND